MKVTMRHSILISVMAIILQIFIVHNAHQPCILNYKTLETNFSSASNSTNFSSSGSSDLVISGEPAFVGDTLTAALMVTNNGNQTGSVSLQITNDESERTFQGEYISISPGSTREVQTSFTMELPGINEFNWQLSVQGQPGQGHHSRRGA